MLKSHSQNLFTTAATVTAAVAILIAGMVLGTMAGLVWLERPSIHETEAEGGHAHPAEDQEDHVALTEQAFKNLDITIGPVNHADYFRVAMIPCEVVEKQGQSNLSIAAPVGGVVTRLHAYEGQAIKLGDPLFDLLVTDDALTKAQLELLDVMSRLAIVKSEINRLSPLAETGAVVGRRKLEFEYELQQLESKRQLRLQELRVRGLTEAQTERIVSQNELIREFTVHLRSQVESASNLDPTDSVAVSAQAVEKEDWPNDGLEFSIERLHVYPGKAVQRGEEMAHISYHTVLHIQGQAFESDIDAISRLRRDDVAVKAELGIAGHEVVRENLRVLYVDNHVDADTQTFPFYIPLRNEVVHDTRDDQGRVYRSWRFKPGQRGHVILPIDKLEHQFKLPRAAVVQEGPDSFVFRKHEHVHTLADDPAHEEDAYIEFEPVPVHVLHQDIDFAVVADDGQLHVGDTVAMSSAYQIHLALKTQTGGGGHAHDHAH